MDVQAVSVVIAPLGREIRVRHDSVMAALDERSWSGETAGRGCTPEESHRGTRYERSQAMGIRRFPRATALFF